MYICTYIYIYTYIYTHVYIYIHTLSNYRGGPGVARLDAVVSPHRLDLLHKLLYHTTVLTIPYLVYESIV